MCQAIEEWALEERMEGERIGIEKGEKLGIEKGEKLGIEKGEKRILQFMIEKNIISNDEAINIIKTLAAMSE